jgi:Xaa-Pro aminopeptidase
MIHPIHSQLFEKNRKKLRNRLEQGTIALFFSSHQMPKNGDQFFPFRQNSDLFYLTGINQPGTILLISSEKEILFINQPTETEKLWEGDTLDLDEASKCSGIVKTTWNGDFSKILNKELKSIHKVYFNTALTVEKESIRSKDEIFLARFRERFPFHHIATIRPIMKELRLVKEPEEIEQIKKGIEITHEAFLDILEDLKPEVNEKKLEALLRYKFLIRGSSGPAYDPIIASGKNACILHYTKNNAYCRENDLLLMDIGAEINNYASDISRTVPVKGRFSDRQKECYLAVLEVMEKTIQSIKPGITLSELNSRTKNWLIEKHIELGLYHEKDLEKEDLGKKYFPHGVAHFMGLDVHDYGDKDTGLKEGMVITCEPGLYIPEENIGIRIEDDILVGNPSVNLSEKIPKTIEELEKLIGK